MENNPLNLDPVWGLPSYRAGNIFDQGDACANSFTLLYCMVAARTPVPISLENAPELLTSADGWPRRSPDESKWYGRPGRCSRDQLTPYLCFMAASYPPTSKFFPVLHTMSKHGFLFANNTKRNFVYDTPAEHALKSTPDVPYRPGWKLPDLLFMDIWAICVRGIALRWPVKALALPLLCLLDLQGLVSALSTKYFGRSKVSDERNQALKMHFAATYVPTPVSRLAYRIYAGTRPNEAFRSFWMQAGEPAVHEYMARLYPENQ